MATKFNFSNADGIKKAIKSVCGRGAALQIDIQRVALACLEHTKKHGDWTLARDLIEGVSTSKGVKYNSLRQWFEAFMHASFVRDNSGNMVFVYDKGHNKESIDIKQAEAVNWFDFKPPRGDASKSLEEIQAAVNRMLKISLKKGKLRKEEAEKIQGVLGELLEAREKADEAEKLEAHLQEQEDADTTVVAWQKPASPEKLAQLAQLATTH